jgi:peptidoglycan/LPS O-acetylase OafA/YrhL
LYFLGSAAAVFFLAAPHVATTSGPVYLVYRVSGHLAFSFGVGIAAASLRSRWKVALPTVERPWGSAIALLCIGTVIIRNLGFFTVASSLLLGTAFLIFIYGNTLSGVLISKPAMMLGKCSYSLYVCHGLVLTSILALLKPCIPLAQCPVAYTWILIAVSSLAVLGTSLLCYRFIESPFLALAAQPGSFSRWSAMPRRHLCGDHQ